MKTFEAKGTFNNNGTHAFAKLVAAESEKMAKEKVFALIGGKQRIGRRNILIESMTVKK